MLEEAIKASLSEAQKVKKSRLVFSDDSDVECVSLSSASEQDTSDIEYLGQSVGGETTSSNLIDGHNSKDTLNGHVGGQRSEGRRSRKRLSSNTDIIDELPCKLMKTELASPPVLNPVTGDISSAHLLNPLAGVGSNSPLLNPVAGRDVCRILFRLPDGSRLQHQFLTSSTIKVQCVYVCLLYD